MPWLSWAQGVTSIHITRDRSTPPCWIKDLAVRANGSRFLADKKTIAHPEAHGIVIETQTHMENVNVQNFGGDGIHFYGSIANAKTNVSHWDVRNVDVGGCGGNGVYIDGPDANNLLLTNVDVRDNGGCGIFDGSFLGITVINAQGHNNRLGHFVADPNNRNSRTRWIGCYSEGGSAPNVAAGHSSVFGGNKSSGWEILHWAKFFTTDNELKGNEDYLERRNDVIDQIKALRASSTPETTEKIEAAVKKLARPLGIIEEEIK